MRMVCVYALFAIGLCPFSVYFFFTLVNLFIHVLHLLGNFSLS